MATAVKKKKKNPKKLIIAMLFLAAMFATPTAVVVACGLAPTYAAWLLDRDKGKLMAITVGALNIAAITPLLLGLWSNGQSMGGAIAIVSSPLSWILILAGAGIGWILAQAVPAIIVSVISGRNKVRLDRIRTRQKQLVDEWGNTVTESNGR